MGRLIFKNGHLFDGARFFTAHQLIVEDGAVVGMVPLTRTVQGEVIDLGGGTLAPGLIDLQVNGGGGIMLDGTATIESFATIAAAHARLGTTGLLPTLITDSRAATQSVLATATAAMSRVPGLLGLHLEGPHLDPRRPGCHPPAHIRPLDDDDIALYCEAKTGLPTLLITLAPAAATPAQIARLTAAGILVSLGHAETSFAEAGAAFEAGARMVTHLFNAMSQLGAREPGLVGAALGLPVAAGVIADGIHVHPESLRLAIYAKHMGELFLVSDAMAPAGTALKEFTLAGRKILRRDGALRLEDGTLAGADLSLPQAVRFLITEIGLEPGAALAMATATPARLIGAEAGRIAPGRAADLVLFDRNWRLAGTWRGGVALEAQAKSSTA